MLACTAKIAASSAGVAAQNSGGRQPSSKAVCPASSRADSANVPLIPSLSKDALEDLDQQRAQRSAGRSEALRRNRLADVLAGQRAGLGEAVPEQRGEFAQSQLPGTGPLDQREQRAELALGGDQRGKGGAQDVALTADKQSRFAAHGVGQTHVGATAPELSSTMA